MLDLVQLINSKKTDIKDFFSFSEYEMKVSNKNQFCNIETFFHHPDISLFCPQKFQYLTLDRYQKIHETENEIIMEVKNREIDQEEARNKKGIDFYSLDQFPVEHSYIDLKWCIIGEKLKQIGYGADKMVKMDNYFYSKVLMTHYDDLEFFEQESIQKFIDFQFTTSSFYLQMQLWFYCLLFLVPYAMSLIIKDNQLKLTFLKICILP